MKWDKIKKKKFLLMIVIILGIIAILFLLSKIYCFIVFNKAYKAVENFRVEENRYYVVEVKRGKETNCKKEIYLKSNIVKYLSDTYSSDLYCEWRNLDENDVYMINISKKEIHCENSSSYKKESLPNIPRILLLSKKTNTAKIAKTFTIRYIVPTKYEDKKCYKMVTDTETIIIDKETYLPVYSSAKVINKEKDENDKIEMKYQFEVGNVTEENVELPDLTDYTVVE